MSMLLDLLHLVGWAQVGVVVRFYLGRLFGGSCSVDGTGSFAWIPCVTSGGLTRYGGAMFTDLPANVVGCALMGLFAATDLLAAVFRCEKGKLNKLRGPQSSAKDSDAGTPNLRMACFPPGSPLQEHSALQLGLRTGLCGCTTTFASWMTQMVEMMIGGEPAEAVRGTEWVAALWGIYLNIAVSILALFMGQQLALSLHLFYCAPESPATLQEEKELQKIQVPEGEAVNPAAVAVQIDAAKDAPTEDLAPPSPTLLRLVDAVVGLVILALSGLSIAYIAVYATDEGKAADNEDLGELWYGILLGPIGCILRWQLSKLNGFKGWFPMGTLIANVCATGTDFVMKVLLLRLTLSSAVESLLDGIILGFGGSLSTVSTWIGEAQKQVLDDPRGLRASMYCGISIVLATLAGIIIYGTAVWTM